jgi:radical SAM-linked protein
MRIRIHFSKTEAMRFTSHLDLHRSWERTFRRAHLPLAYTQGFSPHPHLNIACALPLGFTSEAELMDAWLDVQAPIDEISSTLSSALPQGIKIHSIDEVEQNMPALQSEVIASEYQIIIFEEIKNVEDKIIELLNSKMIKRIRNKKEYDLRPLILSIEYLPRDETGNQILKLQVKSLEGATGRPEEVLACLEIKPELTRIHRTKLILK